MHPNNLPGIFKPYSEILYFHFSLELLACTVLVFGTYHATWKPVWVCTFSSRHWSLHAM